MLNRFFAALLAWSLTFTPAMALTPAQVVLLNGPNTAWAYPGAAWAADFYNNRYLLSGAPSSLSGIQTDTRATEAWLQTPSGPYSSVGNNILSRYNGVGADAEGQFINKIRNPRGEGGTIGVVGAGGALPTNWAVEQAMSGVATSFIGAGTSSDGRPYVDIGLAGVLAGANPLIIRMEAATYAAALPGQAWGLDFGSMLQSGTATGLASVKARIRDNTGLTVADSTENGLSGTATRLQAKGVVSGAATSINPRIIVNSLNNGATVAATLRIYAPKLVQLATIVGGEVNPNPNIDTGAGYFLTNASISGGAIHFETPGMSQAASINAVPDLIPGTTYKVETDITAVAGGAGVSPSLSSSDGATYTTSGLKTDYLVPTTSQNIGIRGRGANTFQGTINSISVKPVTAGYMPSYPILPPVGVPGDSARAADVVTTPTFDWYATAGLPSGASELASITFTHTGDGVTRPLFQYSDGTANNMISGGIGTDSKPYIEMTSGGVLQAYAVLNAPISVGKVNLVYGWSSAGGYIVNGTSAVTFGALTMPVGVSGKRIGVSDAGDALNDNIRTLQAVPLISQAAAQAWAVQ